MHLNFLTLLLLLLGFSYLLSVSAIPPTRTHKLSTQDKAALPYLTQNTVMKLGNGEEEEQLEDVDEEIERRMVLENQDYGGTGANTDHDPKFP